MTGRGTDLIAAERQRQIDAEGWTPEHDAGHVDESLATVAALYALPKGLREKPLLDVPLYRVLWPRHSWEFRYWKPTDDRVRELVKAGALIAAEIDRLQRKYSQ
jgi:hypothetical protein